MYLINIIWNPKTYIKEVEDPTAKCAKMIDKRDKEVLTTK